MRGALELSGKEIVTDLGKGEIHSFWYTDLDKVYVKVNFGDHFCNYPLEVVIKAIKKENTNNEKTRQII